MTVKQASKYADQNWTLYAYHWSVWRTQDKRRLIIRPTREGPPEDGAEQVYCTEVAI